VKHIAKATTTIVSWYAQLTKFLTITPIISLHKSSALSM